MNERAKGLAAGMDLEMPASGGLSDAQIVQAVTRMNAYIPVTADDFA